jgi:hypothetical protein
LELQRAADFGSRQQLDAARTVKQVQPATMPQA